MTHPAPSPGSAGAERGFRWIASLWRGLAPFLAPHRASLAVVAALTCVELGLEAGQRAGVGAVVDRALRGHEPGLLPRAFALLLLAVAVAAAAGLAREWRYAQLAAEVPAEARARLFAHVQRLPLARLRAAAHGDLVTRVTADAGSIEPALWSVGYISVALAGCAFSLALLLATDWRLTIVALLALPLAVVGPRLLSPRAAEASYRTRGHVGRLATFCHEVLANQVVLRVFGLQPTAGTAFDAHNRRIAESAFRYNLFGYYTHRVPKIVLELVQLLVLGAGGWLTLTGRLSPGRLVAFYLLFRELCAHVWDLVGSAPSLIEASAGVRRIHEVLREPVQPDEHAGRVPFPGLARGVRFEDVSFRYGGDRDQLTGASIVLRPGEVTAFVGPSGSGKSTALQLLLGLQAPTGGRILIGDVDLRDVSLAEYRARTGVVFQDSLLFHASVRGNVLAGRRRATDADVERAARAAEIADWIERLPDGYDTVVSGDTCSGGQRQRLALARALVRDPELLVLDEPVSALDPATGTALMRTLRRLAVGRMVVLVTHQLRDAAPAAQICVFDRGRVVERGTHAELLALDGLYARLWRRQHDAEEAGPGDAPMGRTGEVPAAAPAGVSIAPTPPARGVAR